MKRRTTMDQALVSEERIGVMPGESFTPIEDKMAIAKEAIEASERGITYPETAEKKGMSRATLINWITRYKKTHGLNGKAERMAENERRYAKAKELVSQGVTIKEACEQSGLSVFLYSYRKGRENGAAWTARISKSAPSRSIVVAEPKAAPEFN